MILNHDVALLDRTLNVYQLINEDLSAREEANISLKRLLLGTKPVRIGQTSSLFKSQLIGRNAMMNIEKNRKRNKYSRRSCSKAHDDARSKSDNDVSLNFS